MELADIKRLVAEGESKTLELKKSTASIREVGKTLSAFLNTEGGVVLVGVTPTNGIIGQVIADTTRLQVSEMLERLEPTPDIEVESVDDRLEVSSPGTLPEGIRIQDLKKRHQSKTRNDLIARAFYRGGLIEKWGRGTERMVELCVAAGHPEPNFSESAGFFEVTFYAAGYSPPMRVSQDLSELQREVLSLLAREESMSLTNILERLSDAPSRRTLNNALASLVELNLVEPVGYGRARKYRLISEK